MSEVTRRPRIDDTFFQIDPTEKVLIVVNWLRFIYKTYLRGSCCLYSSVSDPDPILIRIRPDPVVHFDPDPTFHTDINPDQTIDLDTHCFKEVMYLKQYFLYILI